jgi:predicted nuclease with TOPRIM domain
VATSRRVRPLRLGASLVRATLETIQARFDKLNQVVEQVAEKLRINAETAARNESELRQENTELVRRLDTVRLNTEAIAKDEQERRKENAELARQLETVRLNTEKNENELRQENAEVIRRLDRVDHNTEAIAKNEYELRQENTELRILAEAGFLRFAVRVDAEDFRAFAAIMLTGNRYQAAEASKSHKLLFGKRWRPGLPAGPTTSACTV